MDDRENALALIDKARDITGRKIVECTNCSMDAEATEYCQIDEALYEAQFVLRGVAPSREDHGVLQDDLREMLQALGMFDGAQQKSPHQVLQEALAEMRRRLAATEVAGVPAFGMVKANGELLPCATAEEDAIFHMFAPMFDVSADHVRAKLEGAGWRPVRVTISHDGPRSAAMNGSPDIQAALCWAMDEIDVLANKVCGWAYPQAMVMGADRKSEQANYVRAVEARRSTAMTAEPATAAVEVYLNNLPVKKKMIGGEMVDVVEPSYLLASDREAILSALAALSSAPVAGASPTREQIADVVDQTVEITASVGSFEINGGAVADAVLALFVPRNERQTEAG